MIYLDEKEINISFIHENDFYESNLVPKLVKGIFIVKVLWLLRCRYTCCTLTNASVDWLGECLNTVAYVMQPKWQNLNDPQQLVDVKSVSCCGRTFWKLLVSCFAFLQLTALPLTFKAPVSLGVVSQLLVHQNPHNLPAIPGSFLSLTHPCKQYLTCTYSAPYWGKPQFLSGYFKDGCTLAPQPKR